MLLYLIQKQPNEMRANFGINSQWYIVYRFREMFYSYENPYLDARDLELQASNDLVTQAHLSNT
jgi:hypothetical protein